jgi:hypothetical protein
MKTWYHEYKEHCRFHDYFNIMVNNFPILTFRRVDFDLHRPKQTSIFMIGILGFTKNIIIDV